MAAIRGDRNRTWAPSTTGTITEDLRNFGLVQISPKFERSPKTSQTLHRRVKEIQEGERCHTMYISFCSSVSTTVMYSAMQSWYCFDWSWSRASMPPGSIAGFVRLFSLFRLQPARKCRLKIQNRKIFIHPCVIKA